MLMPRGAQPLRRVLRCFDADDFATMQAYVFFFITLPLSSRAADVSLMPPIRLLFAMPLMRC